MFLSLIKDDMWMSWRLALGLQMIRKDGEVQRKMIELIVPKEQCSKSQSAFFFLLVPWSLRIFGIANRTRIDLTIEESL